MLVTAILRGIDDDERLGSILDTAPPLRNLIQAYNKQALAGKNMSVVTTNSTGKDLKDAIEKMDPQEQMLLLKIFSSGVEDLDNPLPPQEPLVVNNKQIPDFMIKAIAIIFVVVSCTVVGVTVGAIYNKVMVMKTN